MFGTSHADNLLPFYQMDMSEILTSLFAYFGQVCVNKYGPNY